MPGRFVPGKSQPVGQTHEGPAVRGILIPTHQFTFFSWKTWARGEGRPAALANRLASSRSRESLASLRGTRIPRRLSAGGRPLRLRCVAWQAARQGQAVAPREVAEASALSCRMLAATHLSSTWVCRFPLRPSSVGPRGSRQGRERTPLAPPMRGGGKEAARNPRASKRSKTCRDGGRVDDRGGVRNGPGGQRPLH
jgi:hypothetical protein